MVGWLVVLMWVCDAVNPSLPESDLQILLCLTPDGFTRQREIPWGLKGFIVSIVIRLNFTLTVCLVDVYYFELYSVPLQDVCTQAARKTFNTRTFIFLQNWETACSTIHPYFFLKHLSSPESQILESDWLIPRAPAVLIFSSGPRVRTVPSFPGLRLFATL